MTAARGARSERFQVVAVALSVAAHVALLVAILCRLGTAPVFQEPPVMNVELRSWPKAPARRPLAAHPLTTSSRPMDRPALHEAAAAPPTAAPPPPVVMPSGEGQGAVTALRGLLGCRHANLMGMTDRERRDCQDRFAATPEAAPSLRVDLSRHGAFTQEVEPYLQRAPKRGCKPKAGGDVDPMGKVGAATGVSCAWRF